MVHIVPLSPCIFPPHNDEQRRWGAKGAVYELHSLRSSTLVRHESTLAIPADHPAFAGHFPDLPIVPGVVLLDAALFAIRQALGAEPAACRIAAAKFFHPVGPGAIRALVFSAILAGRTGGDTGAAPRPRREPAPSIRHPVSASSALASAALAGVAGSADSRTVFA